MQKQPLFSNRSQGQSMATVPAEKCGGAGKKKRKSSESCRSVFIFHVAEPRPPPPSPLQRCRRLINRKNKRNAEEKGRFFFYANIHFLCLKTRLFSKIPSRMLPQSSSDLLPADTQQTCLCLCVLLRSLSRAALYNTG